MSDEREALTNQERATLLAAYCRHSEEGKRLVGHFRCEMVVAEVVPAVERILAERDRRVRAEALREAADRMPAFHDRDAPEWASTSACKWLHKRADAIEADR